MSLIRERCGTSLRGHQFFLPETLGVIRVLGLKALAVDGCLCSRTQSNTALV